MRNVKNITIAVDPELYRQTRCLAAQYNTSVTGMVRFLLLAMPEALKAARYPGGRPQFGIAAARAARASVAPAPTEPEPLQSAEVTSALMPATAANSHTAAYLNSTHNSFPSMQIGPLNHPSPPSNANSSCKTVKAAQTTSFQPLAGLQSAALQILYFSTLLITKAFQSADLCKKLQKNVNLMHKSLLFLHFSTQLPSALPNPFKTRASRC